MIRLLATWPLDRSSPLRWASNPSCPSWLFVPQPFAPRTVGTRDCSLPDHLHPDCSYPCLFACGPFAPWCSYPWLFTSGPFATGLFQPVMFCFRTVCCGSLVPGQDCSYSGPLNGHHFAPVLFIMWIICPRAVHTADHFPPGSSYCWSFAPGQFILQIIFPQFILQIIFPGAVHTVHTMGSFCPRTVHTLDQLPRTVHTLDQLSQDSSYSEPFAPVPFTACPLTAPWLFIL